MIRRSPTSKDLADPTRLKTFHAFPYDFGFLPPTIAGDGDSNDVLVLMDEPGRRPRLASALHCPLGSSQTPLMKCFCAFHPRFGLTVHLKWDYNLALRKAVYDTKANNGIH